MDFGKNVIFSDTVFAQEVDGELVLLDMNDDKYFGLDSTATDIWNLLKEGRTLQESYEILFQMYDVEENQLRKDLEKFVEKLIERDLAQLA